MTLWYIRFYYIDLQRFLRVLKETKDSCAFAMKAGIENRIYNYIEKWSILNYSWNWKNFCLRRICRTFNATYYSNYFSSIYIWRNSKYYTNNIYTCSTFWHLFSKNQSNWKSTKTNLTTEPRFWYILLKLLLFDF